MKLCALLVEIQLEPPFYNMKPQKQRVVGSGMGDCFAACVASLLELPIEVLPNDHSECYWFTWEVFLKQFGLKMYYHDAKGPIWQDCYWIASVRSLNYKEVTHAIVMENCKVAFDPSPKKKYRKGLNLLGKDSVIGGYVIVVSDFTKLHKLEEYRNKLKKDQ